MPLIAILFGAGFLYFLSKQKNSDFKLIDFKPQFKNGRPGVDLTFQVNNPSVVSMELSDIQFSVLLNNQIIGTIVPGKRFIIPGKKPTNITLFLNLTGAPVGILNLLQNIKKSGVHVSVRGFYRANGMPFKYQS